MRVNIDALTWAHTSVVAWAQRKNVTESAYVILYMYTVHMGCILLICLK